MKVQCGKYELLDSIFVTQVEGKPIDITLEDPSDKDLYISFAFETNKDEKEGLLKFNIWKSNSYENNTIFCVSDRLVICLLR